MKKLLILTTLTFLSTSVQAQETPASPEQMCRNIGAALSQENARLGNFHERDAQRITGLMQQVEALQNEVKRLQSAAKDAPKKE